LPDPGSQIPDPEGMFFGENVLRILVLLFFSLIKLVPEPLGARKRLVLFFNPLFRIRDPVLFYPQDPGSGSGMTNLGIRIRDKTFQIRNTAPDPIKKRTF
jgi:hypothetical protein